MGEMWEEGERERERERDKDNKEAEETKKKKQQRPLVGTTNDVYSNVLSLPVRIVRCDCRLSVFHTSGVEPNIR